MSSLVIVRISRNIASSGFNWIHEDFYKDEVLLSTVPDNQKYKEHRNQADAPTLFRVGDNYKTVKIQFVLNRPGTLQKLKNIRDWKSDGGRLLVYPSFNNNPTLYYDCIYRPSGVYDHIFFKGMQKAGDVIPTDFLEYQKNAPIVEE